MSNDSEIVKAISALAEPVKILIEKISSATGVAYEPHHIRRMARAQVDADRTALLGGIELTDIQRRAQRRWLAEEETKQRNFEAIADKAIPQLTQDSQPQNVSNDWMLNFLDKAKMVSDEEMQDLWAKVLAGEVNMPGTYTKKTLSLLSSLEKSEAEWFTNLCSMVVLAGALEPLVFDAGDPFVRDLGLDFDRLSHLDAIGLIHFSFIGDYLIEGLPQEFHLHYFGRPIYVKLSDEAPGRLLIGKAKFTQVGQELAIICGAKPVDEFMAYIREKWTQLGHQVEYRTE